MCIYNCFLAGKARVEPNMNTNAQQATTHRTHLPDYCPAGHSHPHPQANADLFKYTHIHTHAHKHTQHTHAHNTNTNAPPRLLPSKSLTPSSSKCARAEPPSVPMSPACEGVSARREVCLLYCVIGVMCEGDAHFWQLVGHLHTHTPTCTHKHAYTYAHTQSTNTHTHTCRRGCPCHRARHHMLCVYCGVWRAHTHVHTHAKHTQSKQNYTHNYIIHTHNTNIHAPAGGCAPVIELDTACVCCVAWCVACVWLW